MGTIFSYPVMLDRFTAFCKESGFLPQHWGDFFTTLIDNVLDFYTSLPHGDPGTEYKSRGEERLPVSASPSGLLPMRGLYTRQIKQGKIKSGQKKCAQKYSVKIKSIHQGFSSVLCLPKEENLWFCNDDRRGITKTHT